MNGSGSPYILEPSCCNTLARSVGSAVRSPLAAVCNINMINVQYVQEVVTLQKKYLIYLHQKMRFTPFINYYDTLG